MKEPSPTDSEYVDVALTLLELSLEYLVYYEYKIGRDPDDIKAVIEEIIQDMYLYIEQDYFLDEKKELITPSHIDNIKHIMLQFLPETHSHIQDEPNVQNTN